MDINEQLNSGGELPDQSETRDQREQRSQETLAAMRGGNEMHDIIENIDALSRRPAGSMDAGEAQEVERAKLDQKNALLIRAQDLQNAYDAIKNKTTPPLPERDIVGAAGSIGNGGSAGEVQAMIAEAQQKVEQEKAKEGMEMATAIIGLTAASTGTPEGMGIGAMLFGGNQQNNRDDFGNQQQNNNNSFFDSQTMAAIALLVAGNAGLANMISAAGRAIHNSGGQHTTEALVAQQQGASVNNHGLTAAVPAGNNQQMAT